MPRIVAETEKELWDFALSEGIKRVLGKEKWIYFPEYLIISMLHPNRDKILKDLEDVE